MKFSNLAEKYRIRISFTVGVILLLFSHPHSRTLFLYGLCLAAAGEALRIWAACHLQKSRVLATNGPYALVRHPLYLGSAMMAAGFCLSVTSREYIALSTATWIVVAITFWWLYLHKLRLEEQYLSAKFGPEFSKYSKRVPSFVPNPVFLSAAITSTRPDLRKALKNKEHVTLLALIAAAVFLLLKLVHQW